MRKFKIDKDDIIKTIRFPDILQPSVKNRINAWVKKEHRYIRVTYLKEDGRIIVVTVTLKEKGPGGDISNENPV
jgi:hypothetical protein